MERRPAASVCHGCTTLTNSSSVWCTFGTASTRPSLQCNWRVAYPKTPCCTQTSSYQTYNGSFCRSKFYIAGIVIFDLVGYCDLDLDPRWPSYTNLTRSPWTYVACTNMNFLRQGFQKLSSDRQTDRQTYRTKIIHHAASPMVNKHKIQRCKIHST